MLLLIKGKKMPIGTVSKGMKKVSEGKWVPVKKGKKKKSVAKKTVKKEAVIASSKEFYEEAKKGPIKSLKVFSKMVDADWNKKSEMMGHIFARTSALFAEHRLGKFMGDKKLKQFIQAALPVDTDDWHALANLTDKEIKTAAIVVNRIKMGKSPLELYGYAASVGGALRGDLDRMLEYGSYVSNPTESKKDYYNLMKLYGMSEKEATDRHVNSMLSFKEKYPKQAAAAEMLWGGKK